MNRNFLVTGGASGIGKAIVSHALSRGGRVFFTDINEELGLKTHQALVDQFGAGKVEFSVHDVRSMESWRLVWTRAETFFSDTGGVEALVNNAGVYLSGDQDWKRNVVDVNITGVMHGTELALEKMKTGVIVQVGSVASMVRSTAHGLYTSSKHAVYGLVRQHGLQQQSRTGVRMLGLCPYICDTPLLRRALGKTDDEPLISQFGLAALKPEEVAAAFDRLLVTGVSGQMLMVHPGLTFYWPELSLEVYKLFCFAATTCIKLCGHQRSEPVQPSQLMMIISLLMLMFALIFHVLLSWLGF